ncbi:unnamed protein product [Withania somnifera]
MMVDTTSAAMSMLSKGKQQIDVMILNVHSSNTLSFHLLAQAVALDIISLAVCEEDDEFVAKNALEEGAYLCLTKPFDKKIVKYFWQFVLREKIQREKARKGLEKHNMDGKNKEQSGEKKNVYTSEVENVFLLNGEYKLRRKRANKINESNGENKVVKQKGYVEWTDDLHAKFVKVIHQLGEGRCRLLATFRNVGATIGDLQMSENLFVTLQDQDPQVILMNLQVAFGSLGQCLVFKQMHQICNVAPIKPKQA